MAQSGSSNRKVLVLPGDGIGPEIMREVMRVMEFFDKRRIASFEVSEGLVGGSAYDADGTPLTDATLARAKAADAVLFGSVGGPKWETLPFELQPERGLLQAAQGNGPVRQSAARRWCSRRWPTRRASSPSWSPGLDLLIVRELTGGIYFGDPRGIETMPDGTRRGINTEVYTEHEIERVVRAAFELARKRQKRLTEVDKANVMESGILWREVANRVHPDYPDVELSFMYADNCAMQLVRTPKQFDVIVTSNLFGDILSDCAAMLTGSLGMLPSASLGAADAQRAAHGALRAGARQRPRHRRQGHRQPARLHPLVRDDAALFVRPRRRGRSGRERGARRARRRRPHRRHRHGRRPRASRPARWATRC